MTMCFRQDMEGPQSRPEIMVPVITSCMAARVTTTSGERTTHGTHTCSAEKVTTLSMAEKFLMATRIATCGATQARIRSTSEMWKSILAARVIRNMQTNTHTEERVVIKSILGMAKAPASK